MEPGWYKDRDDASLARWHDGQDFTEHTIVMAGHSSPPPPPTRQAAFPTAPAAPAAPLPPPPPAQRSASRQEVKADAKASAARAKAMRPWFKKKRFILPLAIVVIAIIAAAAGGGSKDKDKTATSGTTGGGDATTSTGAPAELLAVGQTDNTSGLDVTLLTVESPLKLDDFDSPPAAGQRYIGVELSVHNTTSKPQVMSSLVGMDVRDDTGQRFDITLAGTSRPQIDGTIEPGGTIRGWSVFEVPTTAHGLRLHVAGSITASGIEYDLGLG